MSEIEFLEKWKECIDNRLTDKYRITTAGLLCKQYLMDVSIEGDIITILIDPYTDKLFIIIHSEEIFKRYFSIISFLAKLTNVEFNYSVEPYRVEGIYNVTYGGGQLF